MVKMLCFQCRGRGFKPWSGNRGKAFQIQGKAGAKLERKRKGKKQHDMCRNFQQFGLVRNIQCKTQGVAGGEQEAEKGKVIGGQDKKYGFHSITYGTGE